MIKVAVTGASGFLGQHVLNYLNNLPVEVVAITRSKHINLPKLVNGLWVEPVSYTHLTLPTIYSV